MTLGNLGVVVPKHHFLFAAPRFFCRESVDVERDHLIHRGAVSLPLIGEGISAVHDGRDFPCRARHFQNCGERSVAALPDRRMFEVSLTFRCVKAFPS